MAASATAEKANQIIDDQSLAEEELWAELEKEEIPSHIREARLEALRQQSHQFSQMKELSFGEYTLIPDEKSFLELTTSSSVEYCVVHFFHPDFRRCSIMDVHMERLSKKYFGTKFAKLNVEKSDFIVAKLKIQMLPVVMCFKKGIVVDRIIGFEELGNTDDFPFVVLERRLAKSGVIELAEDEDPSKKTIYGHKSSVRQRADDDSSDDDD
ncbi:thioredoxin domain-containing protein plp1 [Aplysia californica]|uniref:Thioredoxin domain-containing protein 9 n=1 Tax=Aplysia californica TaxID=6500 RepID=A0ABM0K0I9_APLCA|nr:thioredoxin domain-containing protein plp1 [Aplysia californica]